MPVFADSFMGIFIPHDISRRIMEFMASKSDFPYIKKEELIGVFYLFGKNYSVDESEVAQTSDLARRTVERIAADIRLYKMKPSKLDPGFTRQNYAKRSLQIVVDTAGDYTEVDRRVAGDPAILADSFAQHVSHYNQDFFFELFGPLKSEALQGPMKEKLQRRMVLIGFNTKERNSLQYSSPLEPFIRWFESTTAR
jgi:hypothetical protein